MWVFVAVWLALCAAGSSFYGYFAITGRSYRGRPLLRGGGEVSRGFGVLMAVWIALVGIGGAVFFVVAG